MRSPNNFDFIRFAAATSVLVSHSYNIHSGRPDPLVPLMNGMTIGDVAVDIFFIISGYLIYQSYTTDPQPLRYLVRRALRICPALYAIILLSTFIAGPLLTDLPVGAYFKHPMTWNYLKGFGLFWLQGPLPGCFTNSPYPLIFNGPFWTLRIEVACYLLLLFFGVLGVFRTCLFTGVLAAASLAAHVVIAANQSRFAGMGILFMDLPSLSRLTSLFFIGAFFCAAGDRIPRQPLLAIAVLPALAMLSRESFFTAVFDIAFPYCVLCLALTPVPLLPNFAKYGDLSYGIYLYAWPVQQAVFQFLGQGMSLATYIAVCFLVTLPLAALSWHLIEKRALALKPRQRTLTPVPVAMLQSPA